MGRSDLPERVKLYSGTGTSLFIHLLMLFSHQLPGRAGICSAWEKSMELACFALACLWTRSPPRNQLCLSKHHSSEVDIAAEVVLAAPSVLDVSE